MKLKKDVHGRQMYEDLEIKGVILSDLYRQLKKENWNIEKISSKAKTTYIDCKLDMIYENIRNKDEDNFKQNLKKHIITLYDEDVGKYFAGMYLFCYEVYNDKEHAIQNIRTKIKGKNPTITSYHLNKIIKNAQDNCEYLSIVTNSYCDRRYIADWGYYYVDSQQTDLLKALHATANESDKIIFFQHQLDNKNKLYYKMKDATNFNFSRPIINHRKIKKDGKIRKVYTVDKMTDEYVIIKFLKKKIDKIFDIKYPNRSEIMPEVFGLIKVVEKMTNYTIYKFDFKNFFETIDAKLVWNKYIKDVFFDKYLKSLLERYISKNRYCYQGISLSNALVELAGKYFDEKIKYIFNQNGLIFYSRYIDDGLLIFNQYVEKTVIVQNVIAVAKEVFGNNIKLNDTKEKYFTKYVDDNDKIFTYLGYLFKYENGKYKFGIASEKLEKYKIDIDKITEAYLNTGDVELFRQRIQFFISRRVYYNVFSSNNKIAKWDVIGITANYNLLRFEIENLEEDTKKFFKEQPYEEIKNVLGNNTLKDKLYFLKNDDNIESYCLMNSLKKNKSIVFHPNIGWNMYVLCKKIKKIDRTFIVHSESYRQCVSYYNYLLKILE